MSEFSPFLKCEHPVTVSVHGVKQLVPCGSCALCDDRKRKTISNLLQIEETHSHFCNFITLTYDDEHLPVIDLKGLSYDNLGDVVRFCPKTPRMIWDLETDKYKLCPTLKITSEILSSLRSYNRHRSLYSDKYSVTHANYKPNEVAVLYYRDIQLFIKRLRKYCQKNYDEKVRYYVIGEYGTNSLRPHWHLLLFYNSFDLFADLQDVEDCGTAKRPCECAKFIRKIWQFGLCNTKETDGKAYYYVSGYVNCPPNFPYVLKCLAPQKAYHSQFLGSFHEEKDIKRCLKERDYENISQCTVVTSNNVVRTLSSWRSVFARLFPKFSCIDFKDTQLLFRQLCSYRRLAEIYGYDASVLDMAKDIYWHAQGFRHNWYCDKIASFARLYSLQISVCEHYDLNLLSALTSVIYASKRFCLYADSLGYTYREYFAEYLAYYHWLDYRGLLHLYTNLECNPRIVPLYYQSLVDNCIGSSEFNAFRSRQLEKIDKNIKHRSIADRYKFNQ